MGAPALSLLAYPGASIDAPAAIRALLLDDDVIDRRIFRLVAEKSGIRLDLTEAASLEEFRAAVAAETYHVVFLDVDLGRGSGFDALDIIVSEDRPTAIVMISGQDDPTLVTTAFRRGCADYVEKADLSPNVLRRTVAEALERSRVGVAR